MTIELVYLPETAARDKLFMRDLFAHLPKLSGKSLLLHYPGAVDPAVVRMVTKRIAANLSEQMLVNLAMSGDQRNLLTLSSEDKLNVRRDFIEQHLNQVDSLILNSLALNARGETVLLPPAIVLPALRDQLPIARSWLFPENPNSPLGTKPRDLGPGEDIEELLAPYPEEEATLRLAQQLAPCHIGAPRDLSHDS